MSLIFQIALTLIKGAGPVTARHLLERFETAEQIFAAGFDQLRAAGVRADIARQFCSARVLDQAAVQLEFIRKYKIKTLFYTEDAYPVRLKNCADAPVLLYYRGTANLNHPRIVSIVGTRKATAHGLWLCQQLLKTLKAYDVLVVSGLAYGIDVAAHRQSLLNDIPTVGVLAHGLDMLYPSAHKDTAHRMLEYGGLLTEFPVNSVPLKGNFPKRNRIIAGLADVVIVVEAALKGGALITADIANSYNRDVYAFPGRITDEYAQGCNFLIKTNRAGMLSQAKDLGYFMGWEMPGSVNDAAQLILPADLSQTELKIVNVLKGMPLRIDQLGINADITQNKLAMHLLNLELKGVIISTPGMVYQLAGA